MDGFEVTIWGARGSVPISGPQFARYGGNTSCVEWRFGERAAILDAGTGIVPLGLKLREQGCRKIDLILSHAHYDHVIGLACFAPLHDPKAEITVWHAPSAPGGEGEALLARLLGPPFLPFSIADVAARLRYRDLGPAERVAFDDAFVLTSHPLRHPGGNSAFSLEAASRRFIYACDFEHDDGVEDEALTAFLRGADLALLDGAYTADEYLFYRGFGHTFWEKAADIAARAGVSRWGIFHHSPFRTDGELDSIAEQLSAIAPSAFVAVQGMTIDLSAI